MAGIENYEIRKQIVESGLTYKQVAKLVGITPEWFSRLLKEPLSEYDKNRIVSALQGVDPIQKQQEKTTHINKYQQITLFGWMISELNLCGPELIVYAYLFANTQCESYINITYEELAEWTGTSLTNVRSAILSLMDKGYVERKQNKMYKSINVLGG